MSKKISIELSEAQCRSLVWAINIFEASYGGIEEDPEFIRDVNRALRNLNPVYDLAAANMGDE